jgi:hypothetical protein
MRMISFTQTSTKQVKKSKMSLKSIPAIKVTFLQKGCMLSLTEKNSY